MAIRSMLAGILDRLGDIIAGFFAIIPQTLYFLYASMACLMDVFQFVFRKLVGLDTYYVVSTQNGATVTEQHAGDIILDLIEGVLGINNRYSALNTVFWSMIIFGFIVLILMTIITFIKAHYNYDSKKSSPSYILKSVVKAIATMVVIPITTVFGLYIGFAVFGALDTISSPMSGSNLTQYFEPEAISLLKSSAEDQSAENKANAERNFYGSYDFFNEKEWCNTETFSGIMFKACSTSANRVRSGAYSVKLTNRTQTEEGESSVEDQGQDGWDNMGIFFTTKSTGDKTEIVATQIDVAFANNLTLKSKKSVGIKGEAVVAIGTSFLYGPSALFATGLANVESFSKFNVGLVWHYYNLWSFNYILGFGGIFIGMTLFSGIFFGLILRIIMAVVLFLVYPPLVGLMPFDEGKAIKSWREQFMSQIISGYASVIGMNLVFMLLPVVGGLKLFNNAIVDGIVNMLFVLSALSLVKRFASIITQFVGAKDVGEMGAKVKEDGAKPVMKGIAATVGTASMAHSIRKMPIGPLKAFQRTGYWKYLKKEAKGAIKDDVKAVGELISLTNSGSKFINALSGAKDKIKGLGKGINKVLDSTAGNIVMGILGFSTDPFRGAYQAEVDTGEIDENGNPIIAKDARVVRTDEYGRKIVEKRKSALQRIKSGILDLGNVALKAAGDITGIKNFLDNLDKNTAAVDIFKGRLNDLKLGLGRLKNPQMKRKDIKKPFRTKKIVEDEDEEYQVNRTIPTFKMDKTAVSKALSDIQNLAEICKSMKK